MFLTSYCNIDDTIYGLSLWPFVVWERRLWVTRLIRGLLWDQPSSFYHPHVHQSVHGIYIRLNPSTVCRGHCSFPDAWEGDLNVCVTQRWARRKVIFRRQRCSRISAISHDARSLHAACRTHSNMLTSSSHKEVIDAKTWWHTSPPSTVRDDSLLHLLIYIKVHVDKEFQCVSCYALIMFH